MIYMIVQQQPFFSIGRDMVDELEYKWGGGPDLPLRAVADVGEPISLISETKQ